MTSTSQDSPRFVLQDSRSYVGSNLVFWAEDSQGYTTDLRQAMQMDAASAFRQNQSRPSDIPWPLAYLQERQRDKVDCQYVRVDDAHPTADDNEFYCQPIPARFDGNDLFFITATGKPSSQLQDAKVFERGQAGGLPPHVLWPRRYIDAKRRPTISSTDVDLGAALASDFQLVVREPMRKRYAYRCHGCGSFISEEDYYIGECKRCGAENRP